MCDWEKKYARGGEFVEKVCISMNNFLWREFPEKAWMKLMMTGKLYVWEGTMSYMEEHLKKKKMWMRMNCFRNLVCRKAINENEWGWIISHEEESLLKWCE